MTLSKAIFNDRQPRRASQSEFLVLATEVEGVGGIERATSRLIAALTERYGAARVHVLSLWGDRQQPDSKDRRPSIAHDDRSPRSRVPVHVQLTHLFAAVRLAWHLRESWLVVIACHVQLAPTAWAAARASGAAYAVWCHGVEAGRGLTPWRRFGLRRASIGFAPSQFSARTIERTAGLPQGAIKVVPYRPSPQVAVFRQEGQRPTVCTVGRLAPAEAYKGIDVLIRAWPLVLAIVPDANLLVVGDGADRARLTALADALDVTHRIHFTGAVSDVELAGIFSSAQVFALPCRKPLGRNQEGKRLGLIFLEASAAGLPVVTGQGGAAEEVVLDGVSGLLVDPRDERLVAGAITRLLMDPVLARQFGAAGQARAAQLFSLVALRQAIAHLLDGVLEADLEQPCAESSAR